MAVAMCAVVTVAATGQKIADFDIVRAKGLWIVNDTGIAVWLGRNDDGSGSIKTASSKGEELVTLTASDSGGLIQVSNKTGEDIVQMGADEYGNGVVGAYNRKGRGRTLKPGP